MPALLISEVASKLLNESLKVKKGQTITVETWSTGLPLAKEVVKQARRIGAIPIMVFEDENTFVDGVKHTPKDVLGSMGKHEYAMLTSTDAYVFIPGPPLGTYYSRITRADYASATAYNNSWYDAAKKAKLKGVRLSYGYIGKDLAGYLGKRASDAAEAQMRAILADFKLISKKGKQIRAKLKEGEWGTIQTESGEFKFRLKGESTLEDGLVDEEDRKSGENVTYLPPGMATKEVDTASATGTITLAPSLTRLGIVGPLTLEFKKGKLVKWSGKDTGHIVGVLTNAVKEENRNFSYLTVGLNPKLPYGNAVDRFVGGSIGLSGFGFVGIVRKGSLKIGGSAIVTNGKL